MRMVEQYLHRIRETRKTWPDEGSVNGGDIVTHLIKRESFTPDFHVLRNYKEIPLFVFDELKQGQESHSYLTGAKYLGEGLTISPHYKMYLYRDKYPVVMEVTNPHQSRNRIKGELYLVTAEHIHMIDVAFDHSTRTIRKKIRVLMEDQKERDHKQFRGMPWTDAFIYLGNVKYWGSMDLEPYYTRLTDTKLPQKKERVYEFNGPDELNELPWGRQTEINFNNYQEYSYLGGGPY